MKIIIKLFTDYGDKYRVITRDFLFKTLSVENILGTKSKNNANLSIEILKRIRSIRISENKYDDGVISMVNRIDYINNIAAKKSTDFYVDFEIEFNKDAVEISVFTDYPD